MALKALMRVFGFGKAKEEPKAAPPRYHPYDEISDEQLAEPKRTPRVHPYDEVSDAVLEENRNNAKQAQAPVRRHNYDEIDPQRTLSKVKKVEVNGEGLNYVEVELPKGVTGSENDIKRSEPAVVYSEVTPSTATKDDSAGAS